MEKTSMLKDSSDNRYLLTTDAKPEPPRIPIKGYTHNLEPNTLNDETSKIKFETIHNAAESQVQKNSITPEKDRSLQNDTAPIPGINRSTTVEPDLNYTEASTNNSKERKKSNVKTKMKSKQHKYSQKPGTVNYNIINSNDVKIGSRTSYICNVNQFTGDNAKASEEAWPESKISRQMPVEVKRLCTCSDQITLDDMLVVKTYIGHGWKDVARKLSYTDGQIEQFNENYRYNGISEVIYQIFLDWKQANTKNADIGKLISTLWDCKEYDCAERVASSRNIST